MWFFIVVFHTKVLINNIKMFHNQIYVPEFVFHNQKFKVVYEVVTFVLVAQHNHISNFLFLLLLYFCYSFIHIYFITLSHQTLLLICNSKFSQIKHYYYYYSYSYLNFFDRNFHEIHEIFISLGKVSTWFRSLSMPICLLINAS